MKIRSLRAGLFGSIATLSLLVGGCGQSPLDSSTDLGNDVFNSLDPFIADTSLIFKSNKLIQLPVQSALSRTDTLPFTGLYLPNNGRVVAARINDEQAIPYFYFDTTYGFTAAIEIQSAAMVFKQASREVFDSTKTVQLTADTILTKPILTRTPQPRFPTPLGTIQFKGSTGDSPYDTIPLSSALYDTTLIDTVAEVLDTIIGAIDSTLISRTITSGRGVDTIIVKDSSFSSPSARIATLKRASVLLDSLDTPLSSFPFTKTLSMRTRLFPLADTTRKETIDTIKSGVLLLRRPSGNNDSTFEQITTLVPQAGSGLDTGFILIEKQRTYKTTTDTLDTITTITISIDTIKTSALGGALDTVYAVDTLVQQSMRSFTRIIDSTLIDSIGTWEYTKTRRAVRTIIKTYQRINALTLHIKPLALRLLLQAEDNGIIRLEQPYIDIAYRLSYPDSIAASKRDTTTKHISFPARYSDYTVYETDSASLSQQPLSSCAPERSAFYKIDISSLWAAVDTTREGDSLEYQEILRALVSIGYVAEHSTQESVRLQFGLSTEPHIALSQTYNSLDLTDLKAGSGKTLKLPVQTFLNQYSLRGTKPNQVYLFLRLVCSEEFVRVRWSAQQGQQLKLEDVLFSNPRKQ